ncbi:MAG: IclR family transcriptional regulator [Piscinibacter sp.]|nr:IclR family transcriptional regulator [Piscinibacter sp.]
MAKPATPKPAKKKAPATAPRETVSALDRGLALLHCFDAGQRALGASDLARLTGIPRPSVIRLAATLVAHRLLRVEPGGERYLLGAGVVSLAHQFLTGLDLRAAARGPMQALAERSGGSVYLAVRDGLEMVLVEACRSPTTMLAARLDVGSRVPLPNSALGRAWLGALDDAQRQPVLDALRRLHGAEWPALEAGLQRALAEQARSGWCSSAGAFHREINSVAVAMRDARGDLVAFNCGGPAFSFGEERLRREIGPALRDTVRAIAAETGSQLIGDN